MNKKNVFFAFIGIVLVIVFVTQLANYFSSGEYKVNGDWINTEGYCIQLDVPYLGRAIYDINGNKLSGSYDVIDDKVYLTIEGYNRMVAVIPDGDVEQLYFTEDKTSTGGKSLPAGYYILTN